MSTALFVHLLWRQAAARNVDTIVATLEVSSVAAVRRDLESTFAGAEATTEIVRSMLFQGALSAEEEARREHVFLSLLRSEHRVGWIGFGFPDGRFFGARSHDGGVEMIEIGTARSGLPRSLRRDLYRIVPGDVMFVRRQKGESAYVSEGSPWYRHGLAAKQTSWSMADILPAGFEPSVVVSRRVEVYGEFAGVVMVAVPLERLSADLQRLSLAQMGEVFLLGSDDTVLASSVPTGTLRASRLRDYPPGQLTSAVIASLFDHGQMAFRTITAGSSPVHVSAMPLPFGKWRLATAIPRSAFTAEIDRSTRVVFATVIALSLTAAASAAVFANLLFSRPVAVLVEELRKVERFAFERIRHRPTFLAELNDLSLALRNMAAGLSAFSRYMPLDIVRPLVDGGLEPRPGGTWREVTVMFADLPGFTELAQRLGPDVEPYLTQFLTIATEAVHREGGIVDKFIGDAVMAIWNAPGEVPDHALRACRAAVAIRERLPRPEGDGAPRVRIGIHTGVALIGNIGSAERLSYTAIGDTVNLASRLVATAKEFGTEIVASAATAERIGSSLPTHLLGNAKVRGRNDVVVVFEVG
ncbi:adenylate/guanylate cyclase domain-containing protein [Nitratireductor mangrovi]|uniref:Adenylate/guanylate cyclase domain-containing protein n=1 Tax=Nitratireductor mangrovi TaxID=2599600 RepID=A0A5B8L466_9HYPH|nr:adenylate/guanylate cyclase domain-containing protein [Nitratireductor mangrovi]QDZ02801.2 adenylate/guanylate cyclase domain-containing protein [Nitratireductor mangrovi]